MPSQKVRVRRHDNGEVVEVEERRLIFGLPKRSCLIRMVSDLFREQQTEGARRLVPYIWVNTLQAARVTVLGRAASLRPATPEEEQTLAEIGAAAREALG